MKKSEIGWSLGLVLLMFVSGAVGFGLGTKSHDPITIEAQRVKWEVYFSPKGGGLAAIKLRLSQAKESVRVLSYQMTSGEIAEELVTTYEREVDVQVILDRGQVNARYSKIKILQDAKIPIRIDKKHPILHDKVMIIDGEWLITGSYNFTESAEKRNSENLLTIRNKRMCKRYLANWEKHWEHATPLEELTNAN